jgi:hypothetical protein
MSLGLLAFGSTFGFYGRTGAAHACFTLGFIFGFVPIFIVCKFFKAAGWIWVASTILFAVIVFIVDKVSLPVRPLAPEAKIVINAVKPVLPESSNDWPHFNVAYSNPGTRSAHGVACHFHFDVGKGSLSEYAIRETQSRVTEWTSENWLHSLKDHKDQELDNGSPQVFFSVPDNPVDGFASSLREALPKVESENLSVYIYLSFKYWDDSMDSRVFGVKEACMAFIGNLKTVHECGRQSTFLQTESFSHEDIEK